jgi:hypothetical protein
MKILKYDDIIDKIIQIRQEDVIIDSDVAELYDVEAREINQAVSRNPEKFPTGYVFELTKDEKIQVITNCDHLNNLKFSPKLPKAFTERGLYMLATILKSPQAVETTIAIIDTFAQIKQLTQAIYQFSKAKSHEQKVKIFEDGTDIITDLLDNELIVSQKETAFKIKLPFFELSRKITKIKK